LCRAGAPGFATSTFTAPGGAGDAGVGLRCGAASTIALVEVSAAAAATIQTTVER
jgi:hypothetical protein